MYVKQIHNMTILTFPASLQREVFSLLPKIEERDIEITIKVKEKIPDEVFEKLKQFNIKYLKSV